MSEADFKTTESPGLASKALTALLGREAPSLWASTISRQGGMARRARALARRDLSNRRYVSMCIYGIHFGVRLEGCGPVHLVIGATAEGKKELLALGDGYRESEASWRDADADLKLGMLTVRQTKFAKSRRHLQEPPVRSRLPGVRGQVRCAADGRLAAQRL